MSEKSFSTTAVNPEDVPPTVRAAFEQGVNWSAYRDKQGEAHLFVKGHQSRRDLAKGRPVRVERVDG